MRSVIEKIVSRIKKKEYKIDPEISTRIFVELLIQRFVAYARFVIIFRQKKLSFIGGSFKTFNKKNIMIGNGVTVEKNVTINAICKRKLVIGNNVTIGENTIIQGSGVITELGEGINLGENVGIGANSFFGCQGGISVGKNVIFGPRVNIHSENHLFDNTAKPIKEQGVSRKGVVIEEDCWIGSGSIILDGVTIEKGCVVAAGSIVNKSVKANTVVAGVPAKEIKKRI
ncbi:DapH/DapD/GlmU-related protein [Alkalicoccobacillus gibsonii]|uniref:DapH/DapD/GlmU-related protein n=1 Tax=Alkalicoccobacillus gibsonii TaxID=79881 RepID=A0ABU9VM22_9BACI